MEDKLTLRKSDSHRDTTLINVSPKTRQIVRDVSAASGQNMTDIADKLIAWAAKRIEIVEDDE